MVTMVNNPTFPRRAPKRDSVVNVEKDKKGFDPKKYDGTVLRVGAIMLVGDLQE